MKKEFYILIGIFLLIFTLNYSFLDGLVVDFFTDSESIYVKRVIDGDTIVAGNQTIRMLGMNTPEKGEKYYSEAKEFLENKILGEKISLVFGKEKTDRYGRTLAYVFLNGKNINLELVENGFANYYFPSGKNKNYLDFKDAWNECIEKEINLCEPSENKCGGCVVLEELNLGSQEMIFYNQCDFSCDLTNWEIKDEGRKKFVFPKFVLDSKKEITVKVSEEKVENTRVLTWERKTYVWTKTGDTLFLRDSDGKLVLWKGY